MLIVLNATVATLMLILVGLYVSRFRGLDAHRYVAAAAWLRASIYFCGCWVLCWLTGTQSMLFSSPVFRAGQLGDPVWLGATITLTGWMFVAYWGIWGRYTLRFDRRLHLATQIPFGILWGLSAGQVIVMIWHLTRSFAPDWLDWQIWLVTWAGAGCWHWWFHDLYWDLYVSPEHDTPFSIVLKTSLLHIPQVALCTLHLTVFQNAWLLIGWMMIALVGATIFMRLPPWWSKDATPAATAHPFVMGLVRGGGYLSPDPANDPVLKAAHSPPRNTAF